MRVWTRFPMVACAAMAFALSAAAEDGIKEAVVIRSCQEVERLTPSGDVRVMQQSIDQAELETDESLYVRVMTEEGDMAWSSPAWPGED